MLGPPALATAPHDREEPPITVSSRRRAAALITAVAVSVAVAVAGPPPRSARAAAPPRPLLAIGAESEYADVIAQVGGRYATVRAIESNPNADPRSFEASPSVAREVAEAAFVVQDGLGDDAHMDRIESGSPNARRRIVDVRALLRLPDSTANPHLWYAPATTPAVAAAVAADLADLGPAHAASFRAGAAAFDRSLQPLRSALRRFAARHPRVPVAVTEPVGDDLLAAAWATVLTPPRFQDDIMNGVDPAPQDVSLEQQLLAGRRVKALLCNRQVTDSLTGSFLEDAARAHVLLVALYETMPAGYHYGSWMLAELRALDRAVTDGVSTERL